MGCNCGDNEYKITVDNNGNCEPTTPIYNITLGNVGINGYSPIVRFINETEDSFNIAVDNITGTETSPAVPKLSYVADQINNINTTIGELGSTYLTRNGSNATLPFSVGNLTLNSNGTTISGSINASGYIATGEIRPRNSSGITIGYNNYNAPINIVTANKAYYNGSEIATLSEIPSVGNGTITITQGGVTKGTFTTNQSGNTTIELEEGGATTNPLVISNQAENRSLILGINENNDKVLFSYSIGGFINIPIPLLYSASQPLVLTERSADGLYTLSLNIDSNTLEVNQDGELTVIGGGGSSYTAGTGIDITNDTISIDTSVVAQLSDIPDISTKLNTDGSNAANNFTVNGVELAGNYVYINNVSYGGIYISQTNSNIYTNLTVDSSAARFNMNGLTLNSGATGAITLNTTKTMYLNQSNSSKIYYHGSSNVNEIATKGDIPTVNNPTITFTQGGVTKGTITLNQATNQTIALDAGGSGGGAVDSVNGQTGTVVLTASDVGALATTDVTEYTAQEVETLWGSI